MSQEAVLDPVSPFPQISTVSGNRNIPNVYWRKAPHEADPGWIIVGPGEETRQADRWKAKGRQALPQYSMTDRVSPKTGKREPIEYSEDKLNRFRYYWFFKNGGAKEFTVEQIVAHNWHVRPPYGLTIEAFPQLNDYVLPEPLWCHVCPPSAPNKNSPAQLIQHAMLAHGLKLPEARELLKDAMLPSTSGGLAPIIRRKLEMTAEAEAEREETGKRLIAEAEAEMAPKRGRPALPICHNCGVKVSGKLADHNC